MPRRSSSSSGSRSSSSRSSRSSSPASQGRKLYAAATKGGMSHGAAFKAVGDLLKAPPKKPRGGGGRSGGWGRR